MRTMTTREYMNLPVNERPLVGTAVDGIVYPIIGVAAPLYASHYSVRARILNHPTLQSVTLSPGDLLTELTEPAYDGPAIQRDLFGEPALNSKATKPTRRRGKKAS